MTSSVLIVEDEESISLSLEFLLRKEGYDVSCARDGAAALQMLAQRVPDMVLLDVMLPLVDGFELCRMMRANPALEKTRIMLLTARCRESEVARGLGLGADAYLTKPFSTRELMETVRRLISGSTRPAS